jgi:hypothetical protein
VTPDLQKGAIDHNGWPVGWEAEPPHSCAAATLPTARAADLGRAPATFTSLGSPSCARRQTTAANVSIAPHSKHRPEKRCVSEGRARQQSPMLRRQACHPINSFLSNSMHPHLCLPPKRKSDVAVAALNSRRRPIATHTAHGKSSLNRRQKPTAASMPTTPGANTRTTASFRTSPNLYARRAAQKNEYSLNLATALNTKTAETRTRSADSLMLGAAFILTTHLNRVDNLRAKTHGVDRKPHVRAANFILRGTPRTCVHNLGIDLLRSAQNKNSIRVLPTLRASRYDGAVDVDIRARALRG